MVVRAATGGSVSRDAIASTSRDEGAGNAEGAGAAVGFQDRRNRWRLSCSPRASRLVIARRLRFISRWISVVRLFDSAVAVAASSAGWCCRGACVVFGRERSRALAGHPVGQFRPDRRRCKARSSRRPGLSTLPGDVVREAAGDFERAEFVGLAIVVSHVSCQSSVVSCNGLSIVSHPHPGPLPSRERERKFRTLHVLTWACRRRFGRLSKFWI